MTKESLYIVCFMVLAAAVFGSAVSGLYITSAETLERNRQLLLQRSYLHAFGLADPGRMASRDIAEFVSRRIEVAPGALVDPVSGESIDKITAYTDDTQTQVHGYGFRFRGAGFWGPIEGILALDPDLRRTLGIAILEQQETPGLGGRIEEPIFTQQFRDGIRVDPPADDHPYLQISARAPDPAGPMHERHIDAVTGATQTGMAMERILNEAVARFQRATGHAAVE